MNKPAQPLTPPAFYVLLSLHQRDRHGYEIMKTVEADSDHRIKLGPGTLYGLIKRLLAEGLIEESTARPEPAADDERRRYYRLSPAGRARLGLELRRFDQAVSRAQRLGINFKALASWAA